MISNKYIKSVFTVSVIVVLSITLTSLFARKNNFILDNIYEFIMPDGEDTLSGKDTEKIETKFPLRSDKHPITNSNDSTNSFDLDDPSNITEEVVYDPDSNQYYIQRKINGINFGPVETVDADRYNEERFQKDEETYFRQRLEMLGLANNNSPALPPMSREGLFDRLFGNSNIKIEPSGNVEMTAGGFWEKRDNPNLLEQNRKFFQPDFNIRMNVNLVAQIGDKLKLNISNNTVPSINNQNLQNIEYTGKEDDIIKKIELGNVNFPLKSSLITGVQSLMGIKSQLQFGRMWITSVASLQRSIRKSVTVDAGGQSQFFELKADQYEENRNFLLGQYFFENYNKSLENFPIINSQVQINKIEVWITNRTGQTEGIRDVVAFMDLGEYSPYNAGLAGGTIGTSLPDNNTNNLYVTLQSDPRTRVQATATTAVSSLGLEEGTEFQRVTMRKLPSTEYSFQPQLGYITLTTVVNPDDVLSVSYRYTYNGQVYQVGEFSDEMPPDTASQKMLFTKLLKGVSNRPLLPIWNLMMKNVYSVGYGSISKEDFRLDVFYQDPGGGEKRYLPEGDFEGVPIIKLLNLDRLNLQNDPIPDGVFDFVEGITIVPNQGKIIFPVLEPFGEDLKPVFGGDEVLERKYLYNTLYDSTKIVAQQRQQSNRFLIKGRYRSSFSDDIYLGSFSLAEGSVTVTAGGTVLQEGVDYQVDYASGRLKILNQGIKNSGLQLNVQYEDNAAFGMNQQTFFGNRIDYFLNEKLQLGATYMRLSERPVGYKTRFNEDPVSNTVLGADATYQSELPGLTKFLDKLPFYSTNAPSFISTTVEGAALIPGHHKASNVPGDDGGTQYLDDFEGAAGFTDLKFQAFNWTLASTPVNARNEAGVVLFPEAGLLNDLKVGNNRANLSWYTLETQLIQGGDAPASVRNDFSRMNYWRQVMQNEVFRNKTVIAGQSNLATLDLAYYPYERGPYNFDGVNIDPTTGNLLSPKTRWAGIQRSIDNMNSDFEATNVEYITFWIMDPFMDNPASEGGEMYINLGNVSEDVLKDGRLSFENGLDVPKDISKLDETPFGYVPKFQQQVTRSFFNDKDSRDIQDVGYDLLNDDEERVFFKAFLDQLAGVLPEGHPELLRLREDPANDNYKHFRNSIFDDANAGAIERYKFFNRPHGNTPILDNTNQTPGTGLPDSEDINRDNSLNESESYFNYRIKLQPNMNVGENYIVDKHSVDVKLKDGSTSAETWYQFKIPKEAYTESVGGISDFRSIRFIRLFLTGFEDSVVIRFAQLQLERNNWRRYQYSLMNPGENIPDPDLESTSFSVTNVGLEQNSSKVPVPYKMPPGIQRIQQPVTSGQILEQDEQSIALTVCGLKDGDSRGVFKGFSNMDLRQYKYLKMFIHAENIPNQFPLNDGDVVAFIRVGSDFTHNYYEYQVPLKITPDNSNSEDIIWPLENRMNLNLERLVGIKNSRNEAGLPSHVPYTELDEMGYKMTVVGNPNLADSRNIMLGVLNPKKTLATPDDDGERKCVEVWFNEMRVTGMNEEVGYAASANVNVKLADLGTLNLSGSMHTAGYGNINQRLNERFRDNFYQVGGNTNLELGKLLPHKWGVTLPVFFAYNQNVSNPIYDPYDKDIFMENKLERVSDRKKAIQDAQDFTSITSFNVSNFQVLGNPDRPVTTIMPWSFKNVNMNYAFNRVNKHNPLIELDEYIDQRLGLQYSYSTQPKYIEPFKKLFNERSPYWNVIKDFNVNLIPSNFTFRNDLRKIFAETQVRNIDNDPYEIDPLFYKNFTWERYYNFNWNLTRSLSLSYTGTNRSRIDEPYGRITSEVQRDSLWNSVMSLGRNTFYTHDINATYNLPMSKIPILDWIRVNASYNTTYIWTAASLLATHQGNVMTNNSTKSVNASFNFTQFYNKSRHLRALSIRSNTTQNKNITQNKNQPDNKDSKNNSKNNPRNTQVIPPKPKKKIVTKEMIPGHDTLSASVLKSEIRQKQKAENLAYRKELRNWRKKKNNIMPQLSPGQKALGNFATMLKNVNVNYQEVTGTVLPGYMDSTDVLGFNMSSWAPGLFVLGYQPSREWMEYQSQKGRMTTDSIFNNLFMQRYTQNVNITANLEPIPDLKIDLKYNSNFSKNYSEIYKYNWTENQFEHLNPYDMGSFNISYIGIRTMFDALSSSEMTQAFENMLDYRKTISNRLGNMNPYTRGLSDPLDPEYAKGYGRYSQDVLIPAFIAAYTGKDPNSAPLIVYEDRTIRNNPFRNFRALPNWTINYTGLTKVGNLSEKFRTFKLTHAYSGTLSMNSFNSNLLYRDWFGVGFPSFIDSNSGNYVPYFLVPNITISESFTPFIEIDMVLQNSFQIKAKYNKSRVLSLSLIDYQVSETQTSEIGLGGGYRFKGVNLPFRLFGLDRLENDLNFKFTVLYRNDLTVNAYMATQNITPVRGQKLITINPTLDYIINDNFQITLYYERTQTIPAVLLSYPMTNTRAGLTIRYILSEGFGL